MATEIETTNESVTNRVDETSHSMWSTLPTKRHMPKGDALRESGAACAALMAVITQQDRAILAMQDGRDASDALQAVGEAREAAGLAR